MALSIFGRIGTIRGESSDARHADEIDVLSWSWGVSQAGSTGHGGGRGAGRATFHDLTFTHRVDRASPLLLKACATGEHLRDAVISVRRDGPNPQDHLVVTMTDVLVTDVALSIGAEADAGVESVVLAFGKVDLAYRPQQADGSLEAGVHFVYDLKAQRAG